MNKVTRNIRSYCSRYCLNREKPGHTPQKCTHLVLRDCESFARKLLTLVIRAPEESHYPAVCNAFDFWIIWCLFSAFVRRKFKVARQRTRASFAPVCGRWVEITFLSLRSTSLHAPCRWRAGKKCRKRRTHRRFVQQHCPWCTLLFTCIFASRVSWHCSWRTRAPIRHSRHGEPL